jgi:hypothetical protein
MQEIFSVGTNVILNLASTATTASKLTNLDFGATIFPANRDQLVHRLQFVMTHDS